nr:MAG TPA: hypothetical protein [Caudoviricetes sp.]
MSQLMELLLWGVWYSLILVYCNGNLEVENRWQ